MEISDRMYIPEYVRHEAFGDSDCYLQTRRISVPKALPQRADAAFPPIVAYLLYRELLGLHTVL